MKSVDVLGDHGRGGAALDQGGNRAVPAVGSGLENRIVGGELLPPVAAALFGGGEEVGELDRLDFRPQAAGAAEIGNPRFGADAGAGEDHRPAGPIEAFAKLFGLAQPSAG